MESTKKKLYFTKYQLEELKRIFSHKPITPSSTMSEIQYQAGIETVLDFIETKIQKSV